MRKREIRTPTRRDLVTEGLFWSWLINDIEELITMGSWSRANADELSRRVPFPLPPWLRDGFSERHAQVSIAMMGLLIWTLGRRGTSTQGRSRLFQAALLGYGVHGRDSCPDRTVVARPRGRRPSLNRFRSVSRGLCVRLCGRRS
ncbi:MAG: hypothetical protein QM619_11980 [Micropruina sp.]|uniref:hypothetical protein n=1 Tax=Micropruina sp. TaxID=2737536 RepID=UPI0039E2F991